MSTKPSLPKTYVKPAVWSLPPPSSDAPFSFNRPTSGAVSQKELPVGEHGIQLYSLGTPNGQKVTILLEELGIDYDAWIIEIGKGDQFGSGFVDLNPNSKIPVIADHAFTPPLRVFESGAILLYLAEKYKKFIPTDPRKRQECLNWLFWQMGTGPVIGGGFGHFYNYAPVSIEYAIDRFTMDTKRIVDVLDKRLAANEYVAGDEYSIADMAIFPWIRCLETGYKAAEFLHMDEYKNVQRWKSQLSTRAAVKRGLLVNGRDENSVRERHSPNDFTSTL